MSTESLAAELERRIEQLGFELVELERAGSRNRPILRLRIDRPDATPGHGVTVDDCARVSRNLESFLDDAGAGAERYVLEVSSPGVERPLVRPRDFQRFAGRWIAVKGSEPLAGRGHRLEGVLLGLDGSEGGENIRLRLEGDEVVAIPRGRIERAHLIFRWQDNG